MSKHNSADFVNSTEATKQQQQQQQQHHHHTSKKKKERMRLLVEDPPSSEVLAKIDRFEADPQAQGMDIETWAELLQLLLPGPVHGYHPSLPADEPTRHPPGSESKLSVMARRARLGMSLSHPCDEV